MASALILAAGFGTRLRPLTLELPKPAVPVGDRPLIAHVAAACRRAGVERLVANAHHQHQLFCSIIAELGLGIEVVVEPEIRGTAGGVAGARGLLGAGQGAEPLLVWNGDILADAPAAALLDLARAREAQVLCVSPRARGEGSVGMDSEGRVVRLRGRVFGHEAQGADYIGVMALGAKQVAALPDRGCLIGDVALPTLAAGGQVLTVTTGEPWSDLGDLPAYANANFRWLDAHLGARGGSSARGYWCGPGVRIAPGVRLERSLLGPGAQVEGEGMLSEVIAWPGARLQAPLSRVVVLGSGQQVSFGAQKTSPEGALSATQAKPPCLR